MAEVRQRRWVKIAIMNGLDILIKTGRVDQEIGSIKMLNIINVKKGLWTESQR